MIERGSAGRTSGLTDWRLMDVASMWACLQDHDTTNHWKQVAGWRKVCDLARAHLSRLQEYRRGLAEAWPPETNEAAQAYVRELDELIDKVRRTHDAASANYTALSAATQAIGATRTELKKIYDTYAVKVREKQTYDAALADPKAAMGSRVPDRPVTDADLERLNVQARGIMYGLSGELQHAQVMLQKPPPVRPPKQTDDPDIYGSPGTVPAIPPILPMPITGKPVGLSSPKQPSSVATPAPTPKMPTSGPILGGAGPGLAPPPAILPASGTPSTSAAAATPGIGTTPMIPGAASHPQSSRPSQTQPGHTGRSISGNTNGIPSGSSPVQPRPMPPGGLIGGTPAMGLGQPGASNSQPRRVNPIGGVIGGGGAGTSPTGGAGSRPGGARGVGPAHGGSFRGDLPMGGIPGPASTNLGGVTGRPTRRDPEEPRHWDPAHPWQTEQGVAPVVRPPDEEGPIDPGPAIGMNR
ncbi:hypothetical protein [Micromonospora sp. CPCC 205561]|uniref:hypothetical protein n=1 Tax=Micromonospora sp. CPCC 205561 TaxID=3122407 RepID=UPI002FF24F87